jgi:hypothetical protein
MSEVSSVDGLFCGSQPRFSTVQLSVSWMIVVADTSPINYLVLIEEIDVLTKMYGTVVIPRMVCEETSPTIGT